MVQDNLVRCILKRDLIAFKQLLRTSTPSQIDNVYIDPNTSRRGTLLEFAIEENLSSFAEALIDAGADPNAFTPSKGCRPIHEAAEKGYFDCLKLLLSGRADINAKSAATGRTALHELLAGWEDKPSFKSAFNELVNHPKIDINIEDDDEAVPLEIAASKKLEYPVNRLLSLGATITNNARDALQEFRPELLRPDFGLQQFNNNTHITEVELRAEISKAVRNNDVERCEAVLAQALNLNISLDLNKNDTDGPTLLQLACEAGYSRVVEILLSHGAVTDVTSPSKDRKPILLACTTGNVKILQLLLENHANANEKCPITEQTVLHEVTRKLSKNPKRFMECLQTVLAYQTDDLNINAQDQLGNTALHFAVMNGCQEAVLLLLRHGADISLTNAAGISPLKRIHPKILEAYLDECISSNRKSPTASDFILSFDYSFLSAPCHSNNHEVETEFETVVFPEAPKLSKRSEIEILREIASTPRLQPLLRHPVIRSFVAYKWFKISWAFWLNCVLFFAMILLLTGYVVLLKESRSPTRNETEANQDDLDGDNDMNAVVKVILSTVLGFFAAGLFLRELFQMSIDFKRYLNSFENYVEILLICSTVAMLATRDQLHIAVNFAAIAIILAWLELLLLVGRYPDLSTYIAAFVTVSKTFLIMLLGYSLLIVGFALSFYVLNVFEDEGETTPAQGIIQSVMKCYVMMTGELDYGGLKFEEKPFVSKGVFLFFVFLVTIILLNLLNALAVSDTQMIKNKAEIVIYASHIEMISYFESMFLRRPFPYLRRNFSAFRAIFDKCFLPIRRILNPNKVLVFDRCLLSRRYQVYPNANPESKLTDDILSCECHVNYRIDQEVLCEALDIFTKSDQLE